MLTAFGETKNFTAWTRDPRCSITRSSLQDRIKVGWEPEKAIVTPGKVFKKPITVNKEEVVKAYLHGESGTSIASRLGVGHPQIYKILNKSGCPRRETTRLHELNEAAFDDLNNIDAQYWLGFLTADGYIDADTGRISIALSDKDEEHFYKFRTFIGSTHKVRRYSKKSMVSDAIFSYVKLHIMSRHMADTIIKAGRRPRNNSYMVPKLANSRYFWRGLIDGDGTVTTYKDPRKLSTYPQLSLLGGRELLGQFLIFLEANGIKTNTKVRKKKNSKIWVLCFGKRIAGKAIRLIYGDGGERLTRKAEKAKQCVLLLEVRESHDKWLEDRVCCYPQCSVKPVLAKGLCEIHYRINRRDNCKKVPCTTEGCNRDKNEKERVCSKCYQRQRYHNFKAGKQLEPI